MHQKHVVASCVVLTVILANPISQRPTQSIDANQLLVGKQLFDGKREWKFDIFDGEIRDVKTISDNGEASRADPAMDSQDSLAKIKQPHNPAGSRTADGVEVDSIRSQDGSVATNPISIANPSHDIRHTRRRGISPRDQNACPVKDVPRRQPSNAQASPRPANEEHPRVNPASPAGQRSATTENPCGAFFKPIRRPIHVTCSGPRIGPDPFHPAYVLNCVPGESVPRARKVSECMASN